MSEQYTITVPILGPDGSTLPAEIDTISLLIGLIILILFTGLCLDFLVGKRRPPCPPAKSAAKPPVEGGRDSATDSTDEGISHD